MYYEYWNLKRPPFDNVPDPTMYADCHTSMENAIAETLFGIEEGEECISVIVGDVGLGKTMSIRIIIDSLSKERYKIVLVTNPSTTFVQVLREIIGQITGKPCEERKKDDLLEIFNRLLFETIDEGKKILIFIDEANVISSTKLENLRLLTNMQDDQRNLFTMVLVGQMELAKRLEHPKRANLFQRIGTYARIEKIPSEESVKNYVETRLKRACATKKIFTEDSFHHLWECSEHGVPRLINKMCKLSLKAGETNELSEINGEIIQQIGERFQKLTRLAVPKRKPRKRREEEKTPEPVKEAEAIPRKVPEELEQRVTGPDILHEEILQTPTTFKERECKVGNIPEGIIEKEAEPVMAGEGSFEAAETIATSEHKVEDATVNDLGEDSGRFMIKEVSLKQPEHLNGDELKATLSVEENAEKKVEPAKLDEEVSEPSSAFEGNECKAEETLYDRTAKTKLVTEENDVEELKIGGSRFWVNFHSHLIKQAKSSNQEQRMKLAGTIAARALKKNPQLTSSFSTDPVPIWSEIKNFVFDKITQKMKR